MTFFYGKVVKWCIATKEKAEEQILTAKELIGQIEDYCAERM